MEAYIPDIILMFCYQSCALYCFYKKTNTKTGLYCSLGATVCFFIAWTMFYFKVPPHWFHLGISAIFFRWGYFMAKHCKAKATVIFIGGFGLFQAMYSYDWFLYGATPTGLGQYYETIAVAFHLLIMATYTNGLFISSRVNSRAARRSAAI